MATHVLRIPVDTGETNVRRAVRDRLIEGDKGGVLFLADLAFPWCYPGGDPGSRPPAGNPEAGASVRDVSENIGDAMFYSSGVSETMFAGNGFDFSAVSPGDQQRQAVETPSDIYAGLASNQQFLVCMYVKMPEEADWNGGSAIYPILTSTVWGGTYQTSGELLAIAQTNTKQISFRRQTALSAYDGLAISASGFYGEVCQVAYWRNGDEAGALIRSVDDVKKVTQSPGLNNNIDISGLSSKFGGTASVFTNPSTGNENANKYRLYRMFIEDLYVSKRHPEQILSEDWVRTINRGVFS